MKPRAFFSLSLLAIPLSPADPRDARPDLIYVVEASSDLLNSSALATNPGSVSTATPVSVTDSVPPSPRRFLRLRVTGN